MAKDKTRFEVKNAAAVTKELYIKRKTLHIAKQKAILNFLSSIPAKAIDEIIPNTTGCLDPLWARRAKPATPGRITSRTGKFIEMLRAKPGNQTFNTKLAKQETYFTKSLVRLIRNGKMDEYVGTIKGDVKVMSGRQTSRGRKVRGQRMPIETLRTLTFRFMHEGGIRGNKRKIFAPAAQKNIRKLNVELEKRTNMVWPK